MWRRIKSDAKELQNILTRMKKETYGGVLGYRTHSLFNQKELNYTENYIRNIENSKHKSEQEKIDFYIEKRNYLFNIITKDLSEQYRDTRYTSEQYTKFQYYLELYEVFDNTLVDILNKKIKLDIINNEIFELNTQIKNLDERNRRLLEANERDITRTKDLNEISQEVYLRMLKSSNTTNRILANLAEINNFNLMEAPLEIKHKLLSINSDLEKILLNLKSQPKILLEIKEKDFISTKNNTSTTSQSEQSELPINSNEQRNRNELPSLIKEQKATIEEKSQEKINDIDFKVNVKSSPCHGQFFPAAIEKPKTGGEQDIVKKIPAEEILKNILKKEEITFQLDQKEKLIKINSIDIKLMKNLQLSLHTVGISEQTGKPKTIEIESSISTNGQDIYLYSLILSADEYNAIAEENSYEELMRTHVSSLPKNG